MFGYITELDTVSECKSETISVQGHSLTVSNSTVSECKSETISVQGHDIESA